MSVAVVTGSGGLIGSATARHLADQGLTVVGLDNDLRGQLFGRAGSVRSTIDGLLSVPGYVHREVDVRDRTGLDRLLALYRGEIQLVVHCAAQPAHESPSPLIDWDVNATGTVSLLDAVHRHAPDAIVVVLSTIKVYGQWPNLLPVVELETRYDMDSPGISESMSVDRSARAVFGASKLAADVMAQEYGHSLGLRTTILRPGCLTGADHAAVEAHGFLGHLQRCITLGDLYRIHGNGKQVRDQLHALDVVAAIEQVWRDPPEPGWVANLGGGRGTDVSVLEAVTLAEEIAGRPAKVEHIPVRAGDHRWWITDTSKFRARYPRWSPTIGVRAILQEIHDRWSR